jgi:hypothetical protein
MNDTNDIYVKANLLLRLVLAEYKNKLDSESISTIKHYLDHDEYEMAFEGLFLDLMKENTCIDKKILIECISIGKELNIDQSSVFDSEFWTKFINFT